MHRELLYLSYSFFIIFLTHRKDWVHHLNKVLCVEAGVLFNFEIKFPSFENMLGFMFFMYTILKKNRNVFMLFV
jgi:hypothetical protein